MLKIAPYQISISMIKYWTSYTFKSFSWTCTIGCTRVHWRIWGFPRYQYGRYHSYSTVGDKACAIKFWRKFSCYQYLHKPSIPNVSDTTIAYIRWYLLCCRGNIDLFVKTGTIKNVQVTGRNMKRTVRQELKFHNLVIMSEYNRPLVESYIFIGRMDFNSLKCLCLLKKMDWLTGFR